MQHSDIGQHSRIEKHDIRFSAADGFPLEGTLTSGTGNGPCVLISSAAAVPRGYYQRFAETLVREYGFRAALTYDYRGTGGSRPKGVNGRRIRMLDWGRKDFPAALDALKAAHPDLPVTGIGHSYGGLALGLSGRQAEFGRYVMVSTISGYFRATREPLKILLAMSLVGMPYGMVTGTTPHWLGLGMDIPGGVFRDWARWCRKPDFFFSDPTFDIPAAYAETTTPILAIGASDDPWGTVAAQQGAFKYYSNAPITYLWQDPEEAGGPIGHIGYFRPRFKTTLWPAALEWLMNDARAR